MAGLDRESFVTALRQVTDDNHTFLDALVRRLERPTETAAPPAPPVVDTLPSLEDPAPTEHGAHKPAAPLNWSLLKSEKPIVSYLSSHRLNPHDMSVRFQLESLLENFLDTSISGCLQYKTYDAYMRQSNELQDKFEEELDAYRAANLNWKTAGGSVGKYNHKGVTTDEGATHKAQRQVIWDDIMTQNVASAAPVNIILEFAQDLRIPHIG